jgi:hypothetical protein
MDDLGSKGGRGKWGIKGIPHKDWDCLDVYDLFATTDSREYAICEMCEEREIRFIHVMRHDKYPNNLLCGCVCAEHMWGMGMAKRLEKEVRLRSKRRFNFPDLLSWKISKKGNPHIKKNGYHITVAKWGVLHKIIVTKPDGTSIKGSILHETQRKAMVSAFDALEYLDENLLKSIEGENA